MSPVIDFPGGPPPAGREHVICDTPLRLRWGDWATPHIVQVHVGSAALYEDHREECLEKGLDPSGEMPPHLTLDGGMRGTALAMLRFRNDEKRLLDVAYLAGLMECLINIPSPILRTDLIRRVYQEIETLGQTLGRLTWKGQAGHFMLPVMEDAGNPHRLANALSGVDNLQDFFNTVRRISHERHQSLAKTYVIYYPRRFP